MRKKADAFGTAIWITADGKQIRAENHLENLVQRYFNLDGFKKQFEDFMEKFFLTEEDYELFGDGTQSVMTEEIDAEMEYIYNLEPLQIGELPTIANNLSETTKRIFDPDTNEIIDAGDAVRSFIKQNSTDGFDKVVDGLEQPYHFAFKQGDIRVRLFGDAFVAELAASRLNRDTAGRIIDAYFKLIGGSKHEPPGFALDLVDFSGKEPSTRNYEFKTSDEFFAALSDLTRRRVASIERLLKLASVYYQKVMEYDLRRTSNERPDPGHLHQA